MTEVAQASRRTVDRMQVRLEHLDTLLTLAGEVIITSANLQDLERRLQSALAARQPLERDNLDVVRTCNETTRRISQDLHDLVMAIRLVEIDETLRLFRRPVRDLARTLGRDVELSLEGGSTLVDKALAERLVDPILHLLRNAVDHGIEPPLERSRAGKPTQGRVRLTAEDQEYTTLITVADDGRGVDVEAVLESARRAGALAEGESRPLIELLCLPGLTTAGAVSATSGRGVGLDLVHKVVEEFGGSLTLETRLGQGSSFTLEIPKLRAVNIVDALTIRAGRQLFAMPIDQVVASLGIPAGEVRTAMEKGRYILYQGRVVVLHDLLAALGEGRVEEHLDPLPVVIVQSKAGTVALQISEFLGPQKLVNIPLDENLAHHPGVAGTAAFTGGRLGLTLDIEELVAWVVGERTCEAHLRAGQLQAPVLERASLPAPPCGPAAPVVCAGEGPGLEESDAAELRGELRHSLAALQDALLSLESSPTEVEHLNQAFRRLHAAKGNFTMLEAGKAADFSHHLETLLDFLRSGRLELTQERMDLLLDGVGWLVGAEDSLDRSAAPPEEILERLRCETDLQQPGGKWDGDLVGRAFALGATEQLQVVSARKRGEHIYESYLAFDSGRQAHFLVAYLILRRLGTRGTILATLPPLAEIEQGQCGTALKVLWSTPLDEPALEDLARGLGLHYGVQEMSSLRTTVFRHEKGPS